MERLVIFEPGEAGQRSALHIALHPQRLRHIHRLVGEAALVPRRLQGYGVESKRGKEEINTMNSIDVNTSSQGLLMYILTFGGAGGGPVGLEKGQKSRNPIKMYMYPPGTNARLKHTT